MARKPSALAGIFDDEPADPKPTATSVADVIPEPPKAATPRRPANPSAPSAPARRSSHAGKKPVLIHIPEDMHRALRQLSVEEGGEPLTVVTERLLRQYLVKRGHTRFAP